MDVRRMILLLAGMAAGWPVSVYGQDGDGGLDSMVRLVYPALGRMEGRIKEIDGELTKLPVPKDQTWGGRFGYHSGSLVGEEEPSWVQLDSGGDAAVDGIVLVPVDLSYLGKQGEGHGFPKRFKVEVADNPEMEGAVTVVDCSDADMPNPGKYPRSWKFAPVRGRYVRLTSLKHPSDESGFFWALEEMMVMSEGEELGEGSEKSASTWLDLGPQWALVRLGDGQSALGMPVDVNVPSPSKGYLSSDTKDANQTKWVSVDLRESHVINRVKLLPLESDEYEVVGGRGFPRAFFIELSNDPEFKQVVWRDGRGPYALGYPSGCAVTLRVPEVKARYVRLTATGMWLRDGLYRFGLAELQVDSEGENVALGKPVSAYDRADKSDGSGWAPEHLVDGYSSKFRLIEWPEYLEAMEKRRLLLGERADLQDRCAEMRTLGRRLIVSSGVVVLFVLMGGWLWTVLRGSMLRRREISLMREQIARDLHDDIGSNLGGIMLLSEAAALHTHDEQSREDFGLIRSAAEESSTSMRDIVWLIRGGQTSLRELLAKMRESALRILGDGNVSLRIEPAEHQERELSLLFRRHVLLAFKETLHNIRKHAEATEVGVSIHLHARTFEFTVRDNGKGFNPDLTGQLGHGLANLKRRAERLGGSVLIESHPGKGSTVTFHAPLDA
jgi:signal transduction histidine kinase